MCAPTINRSTDFATQHTQICLQGWFRSEEMSYTTVLMNKDAAHNCVEKLGKIEGGKGAIQFIDVSSLSPISFPVLRTRTV